MRTNRRGDESCKQGYCEYHHKSFTAKCPLPFNGNRTIKCPDKKTKTSFYQNNAYKQKHIIKRFGKVCNIRINIQYSEKIDCLP